jgi:hypothetical protein
MIESLSNAKLIDLTAYADRAPAGTEAGPVIWMTVDLNYRLLGLCPSISIRVPVEWVEGETAERRYIRTLRAVRELLDHACCETGPTQVPPASAPTHSRRTRTGDAARAAG